jgi:SAM-dependent methyltransferase
MQPQHRPDRPADAQMSAAPLVLRETQALDAWAARVRANREQVERLRGVVRGPDFYAPIAQRFRADPRREDEPALALLRGLVQPDDVWLDIGAGAGRYALPLALLAREVIALDGSDKMVETLRLEIAGHGIANVRSVQARWPDAPRLRADVALIAHVGYDVEPIGPFLDAMEVAASRLCVAVLAARRPAWVFDELWPEVHGEARATLPALPEFLALQLARDRLFELRLVDRAPQSYASVEEALTAARFQTWAEPGSEADKRLRSAVVRRLVEKDGRYAFNWDPSPVGIVTWAPR